MQRGKVARDQRRETADELQASRALRSDAQQLKLLKQRGHGHCKEADKLRARIEEAK